MALATLLTAGGIVSLPILACSLVSLTLIGERVWFWQKLSRRQGRLAREVLKTYPTNLPETLALLKRHCDLPISRIFLEALQMPDATPEEFRLALEAATQGEIPVLKRFNTVFETIITVSPLLGLLGTILGLMQSFKGLSIGDLGGSQTTQVSTGISEALISTVMGLVVAIFTLLFANGFRGLYLQQIAFIQEQGGQLELRHRRQWSSPVGDTQS